MHSPAYSAKNDTMLLHFKPEFAVLAQFGLCCRTAFGAVLYRGDRLSVYMSAVPPIRQ